MVLMLFVGVGANSHETVGIAVSLANEKRVLIRFASRSMSDR